MGKIKVSFTTALFAFSFLVCVIVAVVFVDRSPKNDFDAFYDPPAADAAAKGRGQVSAWDSSAPTPTPVTVPPEPTPVNVEALLADLPVDGPGGPAAMPATVTPTPLHNPMDGRTPEEIARAYMNKAGVQASAEAAATVPGMAVPAGIGAPGLPQAGAAAAPVATPKPRQEYLPMQSNAQGAAPGMMPSGSSGYRGRGNGNSLPGDNFTNAGSMSPMVAPGPNSNLIGVHKVPGASQSGMMVGARHVESGAQPPPGFVDAPQAGGTVSLPSLQGSGSAGTRAAPAAPGQSAPATALPGSAEKPLLFPPQSGSGAGNQFELPPAPTLRPPIQDPDRRRSDADMTPGSLNPDEESSQAFLISGEDGAQEHAGDADQDGAVAAASELPAPGGEPVPAEEPADIAAQVNNTILKKDAAVRLARVAFKLKDKKLARADEDKEAANAAEEWKQTQAAAQQARLEGLAVGAPDVEHYASLRPDFEPALWQIAMDEEGFTPTEIREHLESIALSEKLVEAKFEKDVEKDALKKAYDKTPSRFASPRKYRLQEIFKKKPADKDRAERVEREIKRLQKQAAGGTDFSLLARQASEAPTAKRGGNLGWVDPSKNKDAARDKALEGLHAGEVTEVLEDEEGYRIYRLAELKEAAKDFDSARENVVADLKKPVREAQYAESLKRLEAGELKGAEPAATAEAPTAVAEKKATPVVSTRVGSSLAKTQAEAPAPAAAAAPAPAKETAEKTSKPEQPAPTQQKLDGNPARQTAAPEDGADDLQKKFLAQELLGEAAARRQAEERGEVFISNRELQQQQQSAPTTQAHNPAQQAQLLYAPGSQVQQFEGTPAGMPAAAAGFSPAQMQDNMQAPNSTVVNYDNAAAVPPADLAAQQQAAAPQGAPDLGPEQTQSESNGWTVVKTRRERQTAQPQAATAGGPGGDPMMDAQMQQQTQAAPALEGGVPPGFEGGAAPPPQQQQQPQQRRGIVGGVKNFFGSFGRQ